MAEKGFGVKEINLIGPSGTPTITSPNNLNLNAVNVAISTNVSIGGTLTVSGNVSVGGSLTYEDVTNIDAVGVITAREGIRLLDSKKIQLGDGLDLEILHSSGANYIKTTSAQNLVFGTNITNRIILQSDGHLRPVVDSTYDLGLTGTRFRNIYADTYYGDGANLTNLPAGAPVGGASTNTVFFENDKEVAVNYQITSTKNAMTAGPISINAGIAVTVPSGCSWTIV